MAIGWLREIEEYDAERAVICTGRFEGDCGTESIDGLPFAEAMAWLRERTERAYADIEWGRYMLLGTDREIPPLPPELAERLAQGRRRPPADVWRDRPEDAAPVRWEVFVQLTPVTLRSERGAQERVVERVVRRLAAAGCSDVAWSSEELDAAIADIDAQWERAGKPEEFGWSTTSRLDFDVTGFIDAPAHRPVRERLRAVVLEEVEAASGRVPYEDGAEDIRDRWGVAVDVHPPGYEFRPALL